MRLLKANKLWQYTDFPKTIFTTGSDYQINTVNTPYQFADLIFLTEAKSISTPCLSVITRLDSFMVPKYRESICCLHKSILFCFMKSNEMNSVFFVA